MAHITLKQRNHVVSVCKVLNHYESQIGYEAIRPFPLYNQATLSELLAKGVRFNEWDCSGSTIETFYCAGLQDPSGFDFNGDGNTETMLAHLKHYTDPLHAKPGALVIFGADLSLGSQHVAIVVGKGSDPLLFSHGSENSCKILSLSDEQTAHSGSTVFLDISELG